MKTNKVKRIVVKDMKYPRWFFMWVSGSPYITKICGFTRSEVIQAVEKMNGGTWKQTYAMGGRLVRVKLQICKIPRVSR